MLYQIVHNLTRYNSLFAILHVKAFSYKPYIIPSTSTKRLPALLHAFNFMETYRELRDGTIYMWHRMRGRETDERLERARRERGGLSDKRTSKLSRLAREQAYK